MPVRTWLAPLPPFQILGPLIAIIIFFRKCLRLMKVKCADTFPTCGTRATVDDVLDHQCNTLLPYVRKISQSNFQIKASEYIGKGAYGKCYVANLAHMLVCAKVFKHDSSFYKRG